MLLKFIVVHSPVCILIRLDLQYGLECASYDTQRTMNKNALNEIEPVESFSQ